MKLVKNMTDVVVTKIWMNLIEKFPSEAC